MTLIKLESPKCRKTICQNMVVLILTINQCACLSFSLKSSWIRISPVILNLNRNFNWEALWLRSFLSVVWKDQHSMPTSVDNTFPFPYTKCDILYFDAKTLLCCCLIQFSYGIKFFPSSVLYPWIWFWQFFFRSAVMAVQVLIGEQTASTDNFFSLLGQGSAPKLVFDMVNEHFCLPRHSCQDKTSPKSRLRWNFDISMSWLENL